MNIIVNTIYKSRYSLFFKKSLFVDSHLHYLYIELLYKYIFTEVIHISSKQPSPGGSRVGAADGVLSRLGNYWNSPVGRTDGPTHTQILRQRNYFNFKMFYTECWEIVRSQSAHAHNLVWLKCYQYLHCGKTKENLWKVGESFIEEIKTAWQSVRCCCAVESYWNVTIVSGTSSCQPSPTSWYIC